MRVLLFSTRIIGMRRSSWVGTWGIWGFASVLGAGWISSAQAEVLSFAIEPIVGYERVQKVKPTAHTRNRMNYGARVRVGIPLVSLEAEGIRGQDEESYPDQDLTIKDMDDKIRLGIRSSLRMTSLLSLWVRGGGQAKRNTHEETTGGVTTQEVGQFVYKPYAGLGLSSRLGRNFELSGGITVVFNDFPRMAQNEYDTTLGFSVRLP